MITNHPASILPPNHSLLSSRLKKTAAAVLAVALLCPGLRKANAQAAPTFQDAQASQTFQQELAAIRKDRESRTPAQKKIHSQLIYASREAAGAVVVSGAPKFHSSLRAQADGRYRVKITGTVTPALLGAIKTLGGTVLGSFPQYNAIYALVPPAKLETLASRADVKFIGIPPKAIHGTTSSPKGAAAPVHSALSSSRGPSNQEVDSSYNDPEGDATHGGALARTQYGVNGSGITVGVISDNDDDQYGSYQTALQQGFISPVTVPPGQSGGTAQDGEGLAMLEVVHRLAPGASLYFATDGPTEEQMAQNIEALQADGCRIILDDVAYEDEDPFQDGPVAQAVDNVTGLGVLYFSCAANFGNLDSQTSGCWEGNFVSTANSGFLDFDSIISNAPVMEKNQVESEENSVDVVLFWAEPLGAATSQYNIIETDPSGNIVGEADDDVATTQQPMQTLVNVTPGDSVLVQLASGTPEYIHLDISAQNSYFAGVGTNARVRGHNACDAVNSFCVAATPVSTGYVDGDVTGPTGPYPNLFNTGSQIEPFSSDGRRRMFFNPDGSPITPGNFSSTGGQVFSKPDFTAADGVTTSVPAVGGDAPFYGTSCATPHAGALAALAWSFDPSMSPAQVATVLRAGALQINNPGSYNRDAGAGILMAKNILAAEQPTLLPYQPSGWSAPLLVSNTAGATLNAPTLTSTDTLYVSWAVENTGTLATSGTFYTDIMVDGTLQKTWPTPPPLAASGTTSVIGYALGSLPVGQHQVKVNVDYTGTVDLPSLAAESYAATINIVSGSTGSLTVTLSPAGAANAGAEWNVDGGSWQQTGATLTGLLVGYHTVNFSAATGYTAPSSQNVLISANQTATANGSYTQILEPVITSGSTASGVEGQPFSYRIVGTNTPTSYGASVLPSGLTVSSTGLISGTPMATGTFPITISAGNGGGTANANLTMTLIAPTGSLTVMLSPVAAGPAGARWNLDGGSVETSGSTLTGISTGQHTVNFLGVPGYQPPASRSVNILYNQTVSVTGNFNTVPAIALQQPAGTSLVSGSSIVNFGAVTSGSTAQLTFTIVNNGAANLIDLTTSISGANATQFHAGAPVNQGTAPNGSTTFVVSCTGTTAASGTATLNVASNDPVTPLFTVSLEATGGQSSIDFAAAAGTFTGLIGNSAVDPGAPYTGYTDLTLSKTGHLTGKLLYGGQTLAVTGSVSTHGAFTGKPAGLTLTVASGTAGVTASAGYSMSGSINTGDGSVPFTAYHAVYISKQAVPEAGKYTLLLSATDPSASVPQGTGYAFLTVAKTGGEVSLSGKLADGTPITASGPLVGGAAADQVVLFDSKLYKSKGLFAGAIVFENLNTSDCDGAMEWLRPQGSGTVYPAGFDTNVSLAGSSFIAVNNSTIPQYLDGRLIFSGAYLSGSVTESIASSITGKLEVSGSNAIDLKVIASKTSGEISGSFKDPKSSKSVPFYGVLFEKTANPQAAGFFISPTADGTQLSGNVILGP